MAKSVFHRADSQVRGTAILYSYLQAATFALIATYLAHWCAVQHSRLASSWDAIVARLQPELAGAAPGTNLAAAIDRLFSREEIETRTQNAHGRRTLFRNAGVMLEMAEYAERNGGAEVAPIVASLRSHALAIRMATAKSMLSIPRRAA